MVKRQRLLASVVFIAIVSGLTVAACGGSPKELLTVPEGAQPGDLLLAPCSFKIKSNEYRADCGTLVVQENRDKVDSRLIALPVTRVHASSGQPTEPIFFLDGGPGEDLNLHFKPPVEPQGYALAGRGWQGARAGDD